MHHLAGAHNLSIQFGNLIIIFFVEYVELLCRPADYFIPIKAHGLFESGVYEEVASVEVLEEDR